jgi:glucans biosynthesis protein
MHPTRYDVFRLNEAPRCGAKSKRSQLRCRAPAVHGKRVCRMHGGAGGGAPAGKSNGRYQHGSYTKEALFLGRDLNMLARLLKRLPR